MEIFSILAESKKKCDCPIRSDAFVVRSMNWELLKGEDNEREEIRYRVSEKFWTNANSRKTKYFHVFICLNLISRMQFDKQIRGLFSFVRTKWKQNFYNCIVAYHFKAKSFYLRQFYSNIVHFIVQWYNWTDCIFKLRRRKNRAFD